MDEQKARAIAVAAKIKARNHIEGLALMDAGVGMAGLDEYGYYFDGTAGLLKKVGKAVKKVAKASVKVVKKVAAPVAAIVAAPVTGGASIAAYGAIKAAKIGKKASKAATAAQIAQTNAMITGQPVAVDAPTSGKKGKRVRVPKDVSKASDAVARQLVESGQQNVDTAALVQSLMAAQSGGGGGGGGGSPAYQGVVPDAASAEAAPSVPSWLVPAGIGVGALALLFMLRGRK